MKKEVKWGVFVIIIEEVTIITLMILLFVGLGAISAIGTLPPITKLMNNFFLDIILIMILLPLYVIISAGISNLFLPIFIKIIKKRHGKGQALVRIKVEGQTSIKSSFIKSLYPALMAVSIAMVIAPFRNYLGFIFSPEILSPILPSVLFIMLFAFMLVPATTFIFNLLWSLNASGLFIIRKGQSDKPDENSYVQNTGNFFLTYLKGFTGIGTIFSYTILYIDLVVNNLIIVSVQMILVSVVGILMIGLIPIFLTLTITPGAIFNEKWMGKKHSAIEKVLQDIPDGTDSLSSLYKKVE